MKTLEELRKEIDVADEKIVAALKERFAVSDQVRELKRTTGLPPIDAAREKAICEKAMNGVPAAHRDVVFSIYERILGGSRGVIETVARGVAIKEGKLLVCRSKGGKSSYLPGGHIEFGETGRTALVREIKEELGVDSKAGRFMGVVENSFLQFGKPHSEINLVYEVEVEKTPGVDQVASMEDWIEFEWIALDKLKENNLLPEVFQCLGGDSASIASRSPLFFEV